ncbi:hypothetical protein QR685DRAFT_248839 [Neurospora intermedia]|uniref:Uncharacterized protein n=1 Tax=Neurospora intermedia TaxID=5142 RepID=A0ABR3DC66_NEUIN
MSERATDEVMQGKRESGSSQDEKEEDAYQGDGIDSSSNWRHLNESSQAQTIKGRNRVTGNSHFPRHRKQGKYEQRHQEGKR